MVGSRFEERLTQIAHAELCALLWARVEQLGSTPQEALAEKRELEEAMLVEFQVENRQTMGAWV
jgi:hypothetical protein